MTVGIAGRRMPHWHHERGANLAHAEQYNRALANLRAPVFLARVQNGPRGAVVSLHTLDEGAARWIRKHAPAALKAEGLDARCAVVVHKSRSLRRCRSLEALVRQFGGGEVVYDPTLIASRSAAVVDLATRLHGKLGKQADGLFIDSNRRTLFAVLKADRLPEEGIALLAVRAEALKAVAETVRSWQAERRPGFDLAVRVGFEPPTGVSLIAVDAATVSSTIKGLVRRRLGRKAIAAAAASLLGLTVAVPANAADPVAPPQYFPPPPAPPPPGSEPAVAAPNFSFLARGAWLDGGAFTDDLWAGAGVKATLPLGHAFGIQVEGGIGLQDYWGVAGHLFFRNPAHGLLGALASYETMNGLEMTRFAGEGALYLQNITINGVLGHQQGYTASGLYGLLDVTFYATPNFAVTGGGEFNPDGSSGHIGFEWQPALSGLPALSVFADATFGENDFIKVEAGLSIHLGTKGVSLIDRQRRYDPEIAIFNLHAPVNTPYGR